MRALPDLQAEQLALFDTDTIFKEGKPCAFPVAP